MPWTETAGDWKMSGWVILASSMVKLLKELLVMRMHLEGKSVGSRS